MGRGKTTPLVKTVVVIDAARTMKPTHANADARFARVSADTAMALDYALDRMREIEAVNPIHRFRDPAGNIREQIFEATCAEHKALFDVRYGVHTLVRRDAE